MRVTLRLSELAPLFGGDLGDEFLLVTSPRIRPVLDVEAGGLPRVIELSWSGPASRSALVEYLAEASRRGRRSSVLWVVDDEFEHYHPDELAGAKLAAIPYFSSPFEPASLARSLEIVRLTDYGRQLAIEDRFLDLLDASRSMTFKSPRYGTAATLEHRRAEHWFSLHGPLEFGQQSVLPTGQMSMLCDPSGSYSFESRFRLNGRLVLRGEDVVHRGGREISAAEVAHEIEVMGLMRHYAVIAEVEDGMIVGIESPEPGENPLRDVIGALFDRDVRYRKVHEIGFGTNPLCTPLLPANFFPNYRHPSVIFGLGLGGFTRFHHDLVCPENEVYCDLESGGSVRLYDHLLGLD